MGSCSDCGVDAGFLNDLCGRCSTNRENKKNGIEIEEVVIGNSNNKVSLLASNSEYGVARSVSQFISFIGWALVITGLLMSLVFLTRGSEFRSAMQIFFEILPGIGMAISGLFLVTASQVTRAALDNADHTKEILIALKEKA